MLGLRAPLRCRGRAQSGHPCLGKGNVAVHQLPVPHSADQATSSTADESKGREQQQDGQSHAATQQSPSTVQPLLHTVPRVSPARSRPRSYLQVLAKPQQRQQEVQQTLQQQPLQTVPATAAAPLPERPRPRRSLTSSTSSLHTASDTSKSGTDSTSSNARATSNIQHYTQASQVPVYDNPQQQQDEELNPIDGQPFLQPRIQPEGNATFATVATAPSTATGAPARTSARPTPRTSYASPAAAGAAARAARAAAARPAQAPAAGGSAAPAAATAVVASGMPAAADSAAGMKASQPGCDLSSIGASSDNSSSSSVSSTVSGSSAGTASTAREDSSSSCSSSTDSSAANGLMDLVGLDIASDELDSVPRVTDAPRPSLSSNGDGSSSGGATSTSDSNITTDGSSSSSGKVSQLREIMLAAMRSERTLQEFVADEIEAGELDTVLPIIDIGTTGHSTTTGISSSSSSSSNSGNGVSSNPAVAEPTTDAAEGSTTTASLATDRSIISSSDNGATAAETLTSPGSAAASDKRSAGAVEHAHQGSEGSKGSSTAGAVSATKVSASMSNGSSSSSTAAEQGPTSSRRNHVARRRSRSKSSKTAAAAAASGAPSTQETADSSDAAAAPVQEGSSSSRSNNRSMNGVAQHSSDKHRQPAATAAVHPASEAAPARAAAAVDPASEAASDRAAATVDPASEAAPARAAAAVDPASEAAPARAAAAVDPASKAAPARPAAAVDPASEAAPARAAAAVDPASEAAPARAAAAAAATAVPASRRRVRSASSTNSSSSRSSSSTTAIQQLLAGQRDLAAAQRRAAAGGSSRGTSSSAAAAAGSSASRPGEVAYVNGSWVLTGFDEDKKALKQLVPPLQARLISAVEAEQQYEEALIKSLYAKNNLRRLQKDGLVLLGLQAVPHDVLYSSMVWKFTVGGAGGRGNLPYHRFRQGDSLLITQYSADQADARPTNGNKGGQHPGSGASVDGIKPLDATVLEVRKEHLLLTVDKSDSDKLQRVIAQSPAAALAGWRLDQSVRDTTAKRQLEAIKRLAHMRQQDSPFELLLRSALVGTPNGHYVATMPPMWVRDSSWRSDVRDLLAGIDNLNSSQKRAIAQAVTRSLTLWQGPPGTGKTRTLLALAEVLVKTALQQPKRWRDMGPLLACADTNAAVDNLVEGLVGKGLKVVRLGQPAKVRASLRHLTLEAQAEATPAGRRAAALREASKALFERAKKAAEGSNLAWAASSSTNGVITSSRSRRSAAGSSSSSSSSRAPALLVGQLDSESLELDAKRKWGQAESLSREASKQVLNEAHVLCATCAGAGDPMLAEMHFNVVVIDESTQATEPATLVPLTQGAQCAVMAGDPRQLPPTIVSRQAYKFKLDKTLFDRLQQEVGLAPLLLDTQYRMNPAISKFPSWHFYDGKLQDGVSAKSKPAAAGVNWPVKDQPVMVVGLRGLEEKAQKSGEKAHKGQASGAARVASSADVTAEVGLEDASYRNLPEARVALQALHALMKAGDAATGAILTPYKGQVRSLEHGLRILAPWFAGMEVSVSSVDGYQGREADVIVFSAVRCNNAGKIGFVSDPRRLNVAITRPRRGLVVVCDPATLAQGSSDWSNFMAFADEQGYVCRPQQLPIAPWQTEGLDPFSKDATAASSSGVGGGNGSAGSRRGTAAYLLSSSDEEYAAVS